MKITRNDVAREAGVSGTTVSFILNGKTEAYNPNTVKKVIDTAHKLGYSPSKIAQALKTGKSNIIVLWTLKNSIIYNLSIISYIQKNLNKLGYELLLRDVEKLNTVIEEEYVDGIIAFDTDNYLKQYLEHFSTSIPIVSVGVNDNNIIDNVYFDFEKGIFEGLTKLIKQGFKKVCFCSSKYISEDDKRLTIYKSIIKKYNLKEYILYIEDKLNISKIKECEFIRDVEVIYSFSDDIAFNLIRILKDMGICVPKDIKIIGTSNVDLCNDFIPSLSSVEIPFEKMCNCIVSFLDNRLKNPNIEIQKKVILSEFIERESTKNVI